MGIYWVQKVDEVARILSECTASTTDIRRKGGSMFKHMSYFLVRFAHIEVSPVSRDLRAELTPNKAWHIYPIERICPCFRSECCARMAPHPGIDTAEIKDKARKDLLDLLHGVCKAISISPIPQLNAEARRSAGRKIWSLKSHWQAQLAFSSNSRLFRNMVSTRFSFWRMIMSTPHRRTLSSSRVGKRLVKP